MDITKPLRVQGTAMKLALSSLHEGTLEITVPLIRLFMLTKLPEQFPSNYTTFQIPQRAFDLSNYS